MRVTRKKQPLLFTYHVNGHALSEVTKHKYLGLILTSDLKWNEHIEYIERKAMKKLGYLRRRLVNATPHIKLLAYKTFIRPVLEYGAAVWDPFTESNIKKLEMVQRKSVRFVFNCYSWRTSPSLLLIKADLEKLQERRRMERLKLFYLIFHNKIGINKTVHIRQISEYAVRSHHSKKVLDYVNRTDTFRYSFFPRTTREWNCLSPDAVQCPTVDLFLHALNNH